MDKTERHFWAIVRWEDCLPNDDVVKMCGVQKLECRLRWFGQVVRGEDEQIVREVLEMEVVECMPVERPRKSWR